MTSAQGRREQELILLAQKGVPLHALGKSGHWIIGQLHIYTAAGRWFHARTNMRGRLNHQPMEEIVQLELPYLLKESGRLCAQSAPSRQMNTVHEQSRDFVSGVEEYAEFMG